MIYELKKNEFNKCTHLIDENDPLATAVILGNNPGRIFVDDKDKPSTGLVWFKSDDIGFGLIGDGGNQTFQREIGPFIEGYIKSEAKKIGWDWFEIGGTSPQWDQAVKDIFQHKGIETDEQFVYTLRESGHVALQGYQLPPGYELCKISSSLLNANEIENLSFLQGKITGYWGSINQFLEKGFGYCIVHEQKVVSVCFSDFITDKFSSTAIETLKEYEGRKLAQIVAGAYVQECLRRGLTPYWDCMKENLRSQAVAEKVGFKRIRTYYVHYFKL
ncbi:GNAT family N-acetyltransferase [Bacillus sp. FSL W7-1360]